MLFKPKSVLSTSKVNAPKTSQLLRNQKVRVNLLKRNVPAVTQRNTREKTVRTRIKFAVSAKSKDTSKVLAEKRSRKIKTAQPTTSKESARMHKLNIARVQLHLPRHFTYDYPLQQENIK